MDGHDLLAEQFEQHRERLRRLSYRMLGSHAEADEAVQDVWIRLSRSSQGEVENLGGWLTTVAARICLNRLRARAGRPEDPVGVHVGDPIVSPDEVSDPESEALLADSVSLALIVVLDSLSPPERLAFVLHDLFDLPFDEIAPMLERSTAAARQLASRARRRVQGAQLPTGTFDRAAQRRVVDAFFAAARSGDLDALVALLHPDAVLRADGGAGHGEATALVRGSAAVARRAATFSQPGAVVHAVLVNGTPGAVVTKGGRVVSVMGFTVIDGKIDEIDILLDPARLDRLELSAWLGRH
jgi:RNA polymerase sigma-70 factor (ECF subfamily)